MSLIQQFVADATLKPVLPAGPEPTPAAAPTKTVLHVGCGPNRPGKLHRSFHTPEWREIRLDIEPRVQPDIVASITDMHPVATDSMDAVWSSHNLEHLEAFQVPIALGEFLRVLKRGGKLLITLPDLQTIAKLVAEDKLEDAAYVSPAGPIAPIDTIYGHRASIAAGMPYMAHRTGFTLRTLTGALQRAGFAQINAQRTEFDLWAAALKP